eukprot:4722659-Prymnesium_polylepis.2
MRICERERERAKPKGAMNASTQRVSVPNELIEWRAEDAAASFPLQPTPACMGHREKLPPVPLARTRCTTTSAFRRVSTLIVSTSTTARTFHHVLGRSHSTRVGQMWSTRLEPRSRTGCGKDTVGGGLAKWRPIL